MNSEMVYFSLDMKMSQEGGKQDVLRDFGNYRIT